MSETSIQISESIDLLHQNLNEIAQVGEWANLMGYRNTKKFSRCFLRYYEVRPCKILISIRLKSIYSELRTGAHSNFEIARRHSLPDEKALNKFVKYHLTCCPKELKKVPEKEFYREVEKFGSKIR